MIRKDKLDNSQLIIRERAWIKIALSFLIIASLIGVVLRFGFVTGLPDYLKFRYLMHAHSHVAMMGWLFSGLYVMIVSMFKLYKKLYRTIFWGIQISVVGMLLSFPVQGYGAISISFTVLHLILSYIFIIHAAKDIRKQQIGKPEPAVIMLMTAFMFMFISTLGTWALGPLMLSSWKGGAVYYAAVQFFLHFQFNGWFIFAMLGLLFKLLSDLGIQLPYNIFKIFYRLLVTSCILTYALAITWSTPDNFIFWTNSLGAILQFVALLYFLQLLWKILPEIKEKLNAWTQLLWSFALVCFIVKMFIQTFVAVPALAKISYTIHNFVIGFNSLNYAWCNQYIFIWTIS